MQIVEDVRRAKERFSHPVLTIGSFDGVHLGHRRIIEHVVHSARIRGGTAALMTLRPHPRHFFSPGNAPNLLTSDAQKEELVAAAGIDVLYVLPFNAEVAAMTPHTFLEEVVIGACRAEKLVVGHDFTFGKNAGGNYAFLEREARTRGLELHQEPPLVIQGERVSSTLIRERVLQGEVEGLETFLGRQYSIRGRVESGRGMGRKLGYPTANITSPEGVMPAHGVYAAEAVVDGARHIAAVNIGVAPTIAHDAPVIEAFLLDFEGELSGKPLDIIFHKRLRGEKKFPSLEELIHAIDADVAEIRAFFERP